jgi:hypothetical protein
MKLMIFFTAFLLCCQSKKEIKIDESISNCKNIIIDTENILKKIPTIDKYKELKVKYTTVKNEIYLSYGDFDNNYYRIDTLKSIKHLTIDEFNVLKSNIYKLSKIGLINQDYIIYNPDIYQGIYIYTYMYEDWMQDSLENIIYISLLRDVYKKDKWFNNTFKIIYNENHFMLLTKIRG